VAHAYYPISQEAEIRRITVQSQSRLTVPQDSRKTHHKKELVEWLKV
jgi:hypothetical protein